MPHGTPDWGLVGPKETVYGLDDLGEHAVRMGSPHLWDRRGDVLILTDFSDGLGAFVPFSDGAGGYVVLNAGNSRQGAFSACLVPGRDFTHRAEISKRLPYPVYSGVGLEFTFSLSDQTSYWCWQMFWRDGVQQFYAMTRYDYVNLRLEYWGVDGLWHIFASPVLAISTTEPDKTGKLVVDMTLGEYVRFIYNDRTYPLTGIGVQIVPALVSTSLWVIIQHVGLLGFNPVAYVDNVIVTQNEP